jgi:hypothetical protein
MYDEAIPSGEALIASAIPSVPGRVVAVYGRTTPAPPGETASSVPRASSSGPLPLELELDGSVLAGVVVELVARDPEAELPDVGGQLVDRDHLGGVSHARR